MGYSGLIYAAIVAGWAAVLVPRWVRRNEEVERAREIDEARGVRVLRRRSGQIHAAHRPAAADHTVLRGEADGLTVGVAAGTDRASMDRAGMDRAGTDRAGTAPEVRDDRREAPGAQADAGRELDLAFARAARQRRRALAVLMLVTMVVGVAVAIGRAPAWSLVAAGAVVAGFVFLARRAAVVQARRRERLRRALRAPEVAVVDDEPEAETEPGMRIAVLDDPVFEQVDPDAWQPSPVPLPTYLTKPMAPRVARTIDLTQPGSWTSGRLDPAGPIVAPPSQPAADEADDEGYEEHRRAVGD
ncbi:MAG TPA: hypothetical protein VIP77_08685 [Jiangellaceae bacterium]